MHKTNIGIFKIAQTRVNWPAVAEWLTFIGVQLPLDVIGQIGTDDAMDFIDLQMGAGAGEGCPPAVGTDASALVALCGKRCYASFEVGLNPNVSKIRTDHAEYITNVLKSGHGSVLEHATWSFAIENVSRVFTGEMNRHRAGVAISEASMRYIRFDDIGFTMPSSLELTPEERAALLEVRDGLGGDPNDLEGIASLVDQELNFLQTVLSESQLEKAKEGARKVVASSIFASAFASMQKWNLDLCNIWKIEEMTDFTKKKQLTSMFRRIIGMGVSTGGVWTLNARALRHILALRGSVHAEEEIFHVFSRIADIMIADEPLLFGDFVRTEEGWVPNYLKV